MGFGMFSIMEFIFPIFFLGFFVFFFVAKVVFSRFLSQKAWQRTRTYQLSAKVFLYYFFLEWDFILPSIRRTAK